ncbi:DUF6056 family protein [Companilactobacillus allii]|uniref:Teichoic acid polysaccharide export protein n=1 Tax=Companilactobacillus allii TaxID=1847728 RepID=A0A1P8Q625_9LACO|nr:DUF6056 family protein [Companilactobacillus allii]APX73292.1 hypothetical protein BTM29_12370 [Companilactobacillus allii]USQ68105.1 DUF6056 family protein [Companilactobacillus allii]
MQFRTSKKWERVFFPIVFLYFFIFRFLVIPSGDDYFWGGSQGEYLMNHGFYGPQKIYGGSSNGRWIGNLSEIFTVHHLIFAMLAYAIFWTLLIWCIWKLTGRSKLSMILSGLFVFTFQDGYISTVLGWNAGFINYIPPLALILLFLTFIKDLYDGNRIYHPILLAICTFLMSLVGGLFVEHLTLYQIFIGVIAILCGIYIYHEKFQWFEGSYLLGAIVSAAIMFSHPAYHEKSTYRDTNFDLHGIINNYFYITHYWFNTLNIVVNIALCLAIIVIATHQLRNNKLKWFINIISVFFIIYYVTINIWLGQHNYDQFFMYQNLSIRITQIDGIMTIVYWLFLIFATICLFNAKSNYILYFSMFTYFALISPFIIIISPINSREFFTSYVFLYIATIIYVQKAASFYSRYMVKNLRTVATIVLLLCSINVGYKMVANYQANLIRVQDERFLSGKASLPNHVPYRKYVLSNDALLQQSSTYWKDFLNKSWLERLY